MNLAGKTVLVTGGARRIGAAIVRRLASLGANVVIHCNRSVGEAEALAASLRASCGVKAPVLRRDLSAPGAAGALFADALAAAGDIYAIVNSASLYAPTGAPADSPAFRAAMMRLHADVPMALARLLAARPRRAGEKPRAVVNILDCRICSSDPAHAEYLDSKKALAAATASAALELAPGLRLNAVAPGAILAQDGEPAENFARLAQFNPLRTTGTPDDIADAVAFLIGCDFVTGQTVFVDGGYHLLRAPAAGAGVIAIDKLRLQVTLGAYEEERRAPQEVVADIGLETDISAACLSDDLADTIDYHALALEIARATGGGRVFKLVERLADEIAAVCLAFDRRVSTVTVAVSKPSAMPGLAGSAIVRIRRGELPSNQRNFK